MPSPREEPSSPAAVSLDHVYFSLDPVGNPGDAADGALHDTASASSASKQSNPRDSSPHSTGSESTAPANGSASSTASSNMNPLAVPFSPSTTVAEPKAETSDLLSTEQLYHVQEVNGKGLGLIAAVQIPRGTRIISEEPLLKIPHNLTHLAWGAYNRLSNPDQATFDTLHSHVPEIMDFENASRMYLIDYNDTSMEDGEVDELVAEQVRVMSTFAVNNFNLVPDGLAVYAVASRLNHSCVPNTYHGFNPNLQKFTVHAVRDINRGEELTINYIGGAADYMVRTQRIEHLRVNYGFTCTCAACTDRTTASDSRRELLSGIVWGLGQYELGAPPAYPYIPDGPEQAFKGAVDTINYALAEGLQSMELLKAFHNASRHALALKDWDAALEYAVDEQEVERNILGEEVQDLRARGDAASCWMDHLRGVVREALGKKAATKMFNAHRDEYRRARAKPSKQGVPAHDEKKRKTKRQVGIKTTTKAGERKHEVVERAEATSWARQRDDGLRSWRREQRALRRSEIVDQDCSGRC